MVSDGKFTLGIDSISFWLPPGKVDNVAFGMEHGFPEDFIVGKLGIESRHQLQNNLSVSDMATEAIGKLLAERNVAPGEIEYLVVVTQTGDFGLPHTSAIVQHKAGIPESAFVHDVSLGCSGFVMGLDIAIGTMDRLGLDKGILVTADAYTRIVDPADRGTSPLFGDAAAATLISKTPKWTMGKSVFGSRGDSFDKLIVRGSGTTGGKAKPLFMDGRAILDFTRKSVPQSVRDSLRANKLDLQDIDHFVFHQANGFVLDTLARDLGIDSERIVRSFADIGNTTSSSVPIALKRAVFDNPHSGNRVLISGFGVGLSWSTSVLFKSETQGGTVGNA